MEFKEPLSDMCNAVHRPKLVRRLRGLETKLRVPEYERCRYEGELRKADVISFCAVRVWDVSTGLDLDATGRPKRKGKENNVSPSVNVGVIPYLPLVKAQSSSTKDNKSKVTCIFLHK